MFVPLVMRVSCGDQSPCRPRASQRLPLMGRPHPSAPSPLSQPTAPAQHPSLGRPPALNARRDTCSECRDPQNSEPRPWPSRTNPWAQNSLGSVSDSCPHFQISTKQRNPKHPHYLGHTSLRATPHFLRPRPPLGPPEATSSLRRGPSSSAYLWVSAKCEGWPSPSRSRLGGLQ